MDRHEDNGDPALLEKEELVSVKMSEDCVLRSKSFLERLRNLQVDEFNSDHIFDALIEEEKGNLGLILLFIIVEALMVLLGLLSFQMLVEKVAEQQSPTTELYLRACLTGVFWMIGTLTKNNLNTDLSYVLIRMQHMLTLVIFDKISTASDYALQINSVGKIINLLSSDFNVIEATFLNLQTLISFPLKFVGIIVVMSLQIGWLAIPVGCIMILIIPNQMIFGKIKAYFMKKANAKKDERIKHYSEIVDGIRIIKLYGWETVFGDILQKFRREEVGYYVLAYMTTCLSKALTFTLIYFSGYICFVWIEANNPVLLSTPLIIATMQLLVTLKVIPLLGYETYFYIHVVLERYAAILNMKDMRRRAKAKDGR